MTPIVVFLLLVRTTVVLSADDQLRGTKPMSMGSAGCGLADDNSALDYNPAGMSLASRYGMEALYLWTQDALTSFRGSIVDSKTSSVGTGVSYVRDDVKEDTGRDIRGNFSLALSGPILQYASLGVLLRILEFDGKYLTTLGYGLIVRPLAEYLSIGATFHDAVFLGGRNPGLKKKLTAGIASHPGEYLTLVADGGKEMGAGAGDAMDFAAGGEVSLFQQLKIRGGYAWENSAERNFYALGAGWIIPRISLEYGFRQNVRDMKDQIHSISLTIYPF